MIELEHEGYTIHIGQKQQENAVLVELSDPNDIWIHVANGPSAHGVISNPTCKKVPLKVIKRVCCLIKAGSERYKRVNKLIFSVTKIKNLIPTEIIASFIVSNCKTVTV
jgi:predicted ribosome quality control (RQC) complex YloA/Tae2 family protein